MASPGDSSTSNVQAAEASRLQELDVDVQDQDDIERDITRKADEALAKRAEENETKRLNKVLAQKEKVQGQIRQAKHRLSQSVGAITRRRLETELQRLESQEAAFVKDVHDIQKRIDDRRDAQENGSSSHGPGRLPNESRYDFLLRTGKITPFASVGGQGGPPTTLHDAVADAEEQEEDDRETARREKNTSHRTLMRPGFDFDEAGDQRPSERGAKRRKLDTSSADETSSGQQTSVKKEVSRSPDVDSSASYAASEDVSAASEDGDYMPDTVPETKPTRKRKQGQTDLEDLSRVDDGNETIYQDRLKTWTEARSTARRRQQPDYDDDENVEEWHKPHPSIDKPDLNLPNGLSVPGDIASCLFSYQRTGVQWLWELHRQSVGGIIGDEMGLGKTVQAIAYLAALHYSNMYSKPTIVVCPATLMVQWVTEFHRWWPAFRVSILHSSGSGMMNLGKESRREDALTTELMGSRSYRHLSAGQKAAKKIIKRVVDQGHILVTTYSGLQSYADFLTDVEWGCAVLDEGHKIRNPDAGITFSCKELRTPHRIILSGTPMQNSLVDLWSLFDFVYPMRLGNLVTFKSQFEVPIRQGGFASASNLQVQTATKCAETLKQAISPYLLQRFKTDVAADLPKKTEQVVFCKLTKDQRTIYKRFLGSDEIRAIFNGKKRSFSGIDLLRKVCNHPDLVDHQFRSHESDYGNGERSGKMHVLKELLQVWKDTGHKTLLFAQTVQMLNILEKFLNLLGGFNFRRMDGETPIKTRQQIVDEFNTNRDIHVFLLTTKVGGIGVNLTGADRVIIYDPDWNPSTDMQARERAWRLGQERDVTILRLMTKGTIEEKIYHRQIFKQFLTNKITRDPQQRESFQPSDLLDLFSLTDEDDKDLETTQIFKDAEVTFQEEKTDSGSAKGSGNKKPSTNRPPKKEDISKLGGIADVQDFQYGNEAAAGDGNDEGTEKQAEGKNSDSHLMHSIFARSGVHAAVEHDHIVNGRRVVKADPKMIEAEARKIADEAAAELRKAEETARAVPIGVPTWTGQFGLGGRSSMPGGSSARPARAGPSSASLMANLNPSAAGNSPSNTASPTPDRMPRGKDFEELIVNFMHSRRGPVFSQVLIDSFNHYCATDARVQEFQDSLRQVAQLSRDRRGRGQWTLRPEYANRKVRSQA
ncbi:DNA repair protein rhp26 [Penicillium capsulatum]|uniref:DNA repair protein rhp26 n=1 Tax=Penicillium capsulatum TaxID=69766 RepID=A0A9W9IJR8_9EURO|nr:DNA repair protein rhp26 [Penicillium capsulatum]KAJ6122742.1 DNA repair protein rhp26 [Penicillium capsulatum]